MKLFCDVTGPPHRLACRAEWQTPLQGAGVHSIFSQTCTSRHLQLRSVERKHSSQGRLSVPVSITNVPSDEVPLQGAGLPLPSTLRHLGKVAFQTAESSQTSAGAQVRQAATGTWGWCSGHTTCLLLGPKMALEQSAAQKQKPSLTPSWHLLCKAKGINMQAVKFRNRQNIFSQLQVYQKQILNWLGVPELG